MIERIVLGPLHTNTYIIATGKKECIIIDPGSEPEKICKNLESINMVPHTILLTHGHIDHTSGCRGIQKYFEEKSVNVRIGIHESDVQFLGNDSIELNRSFLPPHNPRAQEAFDQMYVFLPEADFVLEDGSTVPGTSIKVIHTPGHTPGSVCLYDESMEALFTGDTLFFDGIGHTSIPQGEPQRLLDSINDRLLTLPTTTRVFPGHGPYTTIERENRDNQYKTDHGML
jgi:glyoxylase-like metal-dependent hydrolase (beta-lactamase superfamily II)